MRIGVAAVGVLLAVAVGCASHSSRVTVPLPRGARVDRTWTVSESPHQVLVEWHRFEYVAPKGGKGWRGRAWHLQLWTRARGRWHPYTLIAGDSVLNPIDRVRIADVTGDGRSDVLAEDWQGNHACGPRKVVAMLGGRPMTILSAHWCETNWWVRKGALHVREPWYTASDSVCCPSFERYLRYRWNGRRLVVASSRLVQQHV